jgi:16S rRNA G1207 methylase RsmC
MRVLDLGCGGGLTLQKLNLPSSWQIVAVDANYAAVSKENINFPQGASVRRGRNCRFRLRALIA